MQNRRKVQCAGFATVLRHFGIVSIRYDSKPFALAQNRRKNTVQCDGFALVWNCIYWEKILQFSQKTHLSQTCFTQRISSASLWEGKHSSADHYYYRGHVLSQGFPEYWPPTESLPSSWSSFLWQAVSSALSCLPSQEPRSILNSHHYIFWWNPSLQVIPLLFLATGAFGFFVSIQFASGISWLMAEHVDLTGDQSHHSYR